MTAIEWFLWCLFFLAPLVFTSGFMILALREEASR